jgi:hypothetical protein
MTVPSRYATPTAFRRALEVRLKATAAKEQTDLQRLRRQVAFDRVSGIRRRQCGFRPLRAGLGWRNIVALSDL